MTTFEQVHAIRRYGPQSLDDCRILEKEFVSACQRVMIEENHQELARAMKDVADWMQWMHQRRLFLKEELRRQMRDPLWMVQLRLREYIDGLRASGAVLVTQPPEPGPIVEESSD